MKRKFYKIFAEVVAPPIICWHNRGLRLAKGVSICPI
jgi:hypothetical protein